MSRRILHISTNDLNGGAERVATLLFKAYKARGLSARLMVGHKFGNEPDVEIIPNSENRGLLYNAVFGIPWKVISAVAKKPPAGRMYAWLQRLAQPANLLDWYRGYEDFNYPGIWQAIRKSDIDMVHAHNLHGHYFDLRVLPELSRQVPLVMTLHDAWLLSGHCAYSFGCNRWMSGCGHCPDLTIPVSIRRDATAHNWNVKKTLFAGSRLYIATPSQWLMNMVNKSILQPSLGDSRVIPYGMDISVFNANGENDSRVALGIARNSKVVLLLGDSKRKVWKDYSTMHMAIKRLMDSENKLSDLVVISVGGDVREPERFENGEIRYVPFQANMHVIASYYRAADVYIHAATEDNFPNAVLESLACGTPVVATAVGGISEQIKDAETGFLVPKGDAITMVARVIELLKDTDLRSQMSRNAIAWVRERFTLDRQVDDYLAWYEEVIADWRDWRRSLHLD